MVLKTLIVGAAILASAVLGDYCNVKDNFIEPIRYKNVKVDSSCYQKPFQLQKRYHVNKQGFLEVYIGHNNTWYKVSKDLRVNEKNLCDMLKEESREIKDYVGDKFDDLMDWYRSLRWES